MAERWFVTRDGKTYGPYGAAELEQFQAQGLLAASDVFWPEGTEPDVELVPVQPPAPAAPKPDWLNDVEQAEQGPPAQPPRKPGLPDWLKDVRR